MSIIGTIYEDVTTDVLGSIGAWQWLVVMASSALMMPSMFNQYENMFFLKPPTEVVCIPPMRQELLNASLCTVTSANNTTDLCSKWHVKLFWLIWLKKTWLVFCDNKMKLVSTTMISRMGLMFGCVMLGLIADSFGRRTAISVDLLAQLCLGITMTFCDSQAWFQLIVFLKALFGGATVYMGLILTCEVSSNGWRTRLGAIVSIPHLLSLTCMIPLANSFPNLETYDLMATIFVVLLIILLRWTPESPQWLLYNRKINVAEKLLYRAAIKNGIKLCEDFKIRPVNHRAYNSLDESRLCAGIFTTYNTKILIIVMFLLWALISFHLGYLYVKLFKGNGNENSFYVLFCSVLLLISLTVLLSKKLLLRHLFLFNILLSGLFAITEVLLSQITEIFTAVAVSSQVVVYLLLLNITPRVFAINVRATLFGCCHAIGKLGTMVAYILYEFNPLSDIASVTVSVILTVVLATLCLVLLDVDGRELPDMVEDMDYFSELSKPLRWATQKTNNPSHEEVEMRIYSFGSGREPSHNRSQERLPPQPINFTKCWQCLVQIFQRFCKKVQTSS